MVVYSCAIEATAREYHVYQSIWDAAIDGENLECFREVGNIHFLCYAAQLKYFSNPAIMIIPGNSVFRCIYKYWWGKFWRIANHSPNLPKFSPSKIFPRTVMEYHVHGTGCMGATYMLVRTKRSNVWNNMRTKSGIVQT